MGQASTRSVVLASILIIATNVVLVRLIFFLFPVVAIVSAGQRRRSAWST